MTRSTFQLEWAGSRPNTRELFEFDAVERLTLEGAAEVASQPVETGANISDHVRPTNRTIRLEAWISDTPLRQPASAMDGATADVGTTTLTLTGGGTITVTVLRLSRAVDRKRLAYETLERLRVNGTPLIVRTALDELTDVVVTRHAVERTAESGNALQVGLELTKLRIATTTRVPLDAPRRRRDQPTQAHGPQPADNRTTLARAQDWAHSLPVIGALSRLTGH